MDLGDSILASLSTLSSCYNTYFGLNPSSDLPGSALYAERAQPDKNWKKIASSGLHFASMVGSFCPLPLRLSQGLNLGTSLLSLGTNISDIYERQSYYQEHKLELATALFQAGLSVYYALNTRGPELKAHQSSENGLSFPGGKIKVPHFPDKAVPPHRTPELVARLVGGRRFEKIVVIVHQKSGLEEETVRFLSSNPDLHGVPRVLLSGYYRMYSNIQGEAFKRELTLIAYSHEGYLGNSGLRLVADEIYLAGGYYDACFSRTIADLLAQFCETGQKTLRLRIYKGLVYRGASRRNFIERPEDNLQMMKSLAAMKDEVSYDNIRPVIPFVTSGAWKQVSESEDFICDLVGGKKLFVAFET